MDLTTRWLRSVTSVARDDWNALFPGASENWEYFSGLERTKSDFTFSAMGVLEGERMVGAIPLFRLDYRLDMTLGDAFKRIGDWLARSAPGLVRMPVLGMGSPMTEECTIGFAPDLGADERREVFAALLKGIDEYAKASRVSILALKDLRDRDTPWADAVLKSEGYARSASLPVAYLDLNYKDEDAYLASLSQAMRGDLRRKMRQSAGKVRVEFRSSLDGIEDEILKLYAETRANRKQSYESFDEVPQGYFHEMMGSGNPCAKVMLCWVGEELASFNFFLEEKDRILGKFLGMRYPLARDHNVYFINWMTMIRYCLERRIGAIQAGQTTYSLKVRFGSKLARSWVYFKHRNPAINFFVGLVGPRLAFDALDPDLKALGKDAPYLPGPEL